MMNEEMTLKYVLFFRVKAEQDGYQMTQESGYTKQERESQFHRFCSAFQIVEEAGLESEYEFWCRMNA